MASFRNIQELVGHVLKDAKTNGKSFDDKISADQKDLAEEYAKELQRLILENLRVYYRSYNPVKHKRTYQQLNIFDNINYVYGPNEITFGFSSSAMQKNAVKSDPHMSFVPHLLNYGWRVKGAKDKYAGNGNRFLRFEGSFFIDNAIEEFNLLHSSEGVFAFYY